MNIFIIIYWRHVGDLDIIMATTDQAKANAERDRLNKRTKSSNFEVITMEDGVTGSEWNHL